MYKKKLLAVILAVMAVGSGMFLQSTYVKASEDAEAITQAAETPENQDGAMSGEIGGLTWSIDDSGCFILSGEGDYEGADGQSWFSQKDKIKTAKVNVRGITSLAGLFSECTNLVSVDFSGSDFSAVTDMSLMFDGCSSLTQLDLSSFHTSNVTNMSQMFHGCSSLTTLDVSGFDTSKVTSMDTMFSGCSSLKALDLSSFHTSNVTSMSHMFGDCANLTGVNLSNFNTSNVTDMYGMFSGCGSFSELDLSMFQTSNVTNMSQMFGNCRSLTNLNISSFDTSNVTNMYCMFTYCSNLAELDLSMFNTSSVTDMGEMFNVCLNLTRLNLSSFDTSQVTNVRMMFGSCYKLKELDLSNFDLGNVNSADQFCDYCEAQTIKTPRNVKMNIALPALMYPNCQKWKDADGTVYTSMPVEQSSSITLTKITNHTYRNEKTAATTSRDGVIVRQCTGCGAVAGTTTIYYPKTITLSAVSYTYNGTVRKPSVTVKGRDGKKIAASNYTVAYASGRKNVGQYKVTITFKGNYTGKVTRTFKILPKGTSLSKLSAGKKQFTVKWKKMAVQTSGYQIQYSTSRTFKSGTKIVPVGKNSTTSKVVSKLKAKKKYYVRIRTYKTVKINGKSTKLYSGWSGIKTVTTKK